MSIQAVIEGLERAQKTAKDQVAGAQYGAYRRLNRAISEALTKLREQEPKKLDHLLGFEVRTCGALERGKIWLHPDDYVGPLPEGGE